MAAKPSAVIDTRAIYWGDNLDQLRKLPGGCVDLTIRNRYRLVEIYNL